MNELIRPGEVLRSPVAYSEQARAEGINARVIAVLQNAPAHPFSTLYRLGNQQVRVWLLKHAGLPAWWIGMFTRLDSEAAAACLSAAERAREEPDIAAWLDGLAAQVQNFNRAEPRNGEAEFARDTQ